VNDVAWDGSATLLAIVRYREPADLAAVFGSLREGGIGLLEVTIDTPGALAFVAEEAAAGRAVGVGTVVTADDVTAAADAGAAFVVSPATREDMLREATELRIDAVPGAFTPTEILLARDLGAAAVKLFPAPVGGPAYIRALRGPIPDVPFVPTGGVALKDVRAYLDAGANCVGLGADLVGRTPPSGPAELELIAERAAKAVAAAEA
jgi:2-dehydro-3-deoxyphosphogluconate aldolase / (4S)-4-hydroxy-2-oxoglutarate aldolase